MNTTSIGKELTALESKIKDEANFTQARKTAILGDIDKCRQVFLTATKEIDDCLRALGEVVGQHFDESIGAIIDFVGEQPATETKMDEAA